MEVRRVSLFLFSPPFIPPWALHPPIIQKPLPFVPPEGASFVLVVEAVKIKLLV